MLLEFSVLTQFITPACLIVTLGGNHPVDAPVAAIVGNIGVLVDSALEGVYLD